MKKNFLGLFIILMMTACQQAEISIESINSSTPQITNAETATLTAFPTNELSPYYGEPQPAKLIINDLTYISRIGTVMWITEAHPDGSQTTMFGDAFAIITPTESIVMSSNPSFILKLPIPINPTKLWYTLFKVSEQEINSQDSTHGSFAWNPDYKTQTYLEQTYPPLLAEQSLTLSLESGIYIFKINAGWGGTPPHTEMEADFGFLLEVQE